MGHKRKRGQIGKKTKRRKRLQRGWWSEEKKKLGKQLWVPRTKDMQKVFPKTSPDNCSLRLVVDSSLEVSAIQKTEVCETKYTLGGEVQKELISKKDKSLTRARLNLLKLSSLQHQMLLRWFHDSRKTYNLVVRHVFDHGWHKEKYFISFDKFQPNAWTKEQCYKKCL